VCEAACANDWVDGIPPRNDLAGDGRGIYCGGAKRLASSPAAPDARCGRRVVPAGDGPGPVANPPRTLQSGVLRIGTYFVNPPFEFISDGSRTGFEFHLMQEIARRLDLHPQFVDTQWEAILRDMQEHRYDCIVGGITITPARERLLAWSVPYMTTTLSLVVDAARAPAAMTLADLLGATVGVQAATTDYDAAIAMQRAGKIGRVRVYPFSQLAEATSDLMTGGVDAVMKVYPVAAWFVRRKPWLRMLAQVPDDPQPLGIGFSHSSTGLLAAVNTVLAEMRLDGSYRTLAQRWSLS
jgi:ABC-type amino acid transport substrate-binding protein